MIEFIGILVAFALIFLLTLKRVNMGLTLLLASLTLGLASGLTPKGFLDVARFTVVDYTTHELLLSVGFISILGNCLKETGIMVELIESLRGYLSSRFLLALIPALFGLLPMPGGALMSAPFNEVDADRLGLRAEEKTFVNIWFRHIWFFASPISSTTILISRLAGVNLYRFLLSLLPLYFLTALVGYFFSIRGFRSIAGERCDTSASALAKGFLPIVIIVLLNIIGVPLPAAILIGILLVLSLGGVGLRRSASMIWSGIPWEILSTLAGVMFFRYMIKEAGSVTLLFSGLRDAGFPVIVLATVFPFLIGLISGTPSAGIGIGVPLIFPLFSNPTLPFLGLIYFSIVMGYLMSPLHLCLILTNSYYQSYLGKVYRILTPSILTLYTLGLFYFLPQL